MTKPDGQEHPAVCHCLYAGGFGGIERLVDTLVREQRPRTDVGVLFGNCGGVFADSITAAGIAVRTLGLKSGFDVRPSVIAAAMDFFAPYDIVHIHGVNYSFFIAAYLAGKRVVFTFHGLTALRRDLTWRDRLKELTINRGIGRYIHAVTTVSPFMEHVVRERFRCVETIAVIPNCAPPVPSTIGETGELRRRLGFSPRQKIILTYCRLVHNKRVELVFDALCLARELPGAPLFGCVIVGDGPHRPVLERYAELLGLADMVRFTGFSDKVFDFIAMADVCVLPYQYEPFGIAALEVLSLGKPPLVCRDGGGIVDVVEPISDGAFVVENASCMAEKIVHLAVGGVSLQVGEECRARAKDFDPVSVADSYAAVYSLAVPKARDVGCGRV